MMKKCSAICWVTFVLVVLGGLNWGLVGLFGFNLIDIVFGAGSVFSRVVYVVIGVAAVYAIVAAFACKKCKH